MPPLWLNREWHCVGDFAILFYRNYCVVVPVIKMRSSVCCECDLIEKRLWRNWIETLYDAGSRRRRQSSPPEDSATVILRNQGWRIITTRLRGVASRRWPARQAISGSVRLRLQVPTIPTGGRPGATSALRRNLWARRLSAPQPLRTVHPCLCYCINPQLFIITRRMKNSPWISLSELWVNTKNLPFRRCCNKTVHIT
jgi:hypothetical protein